MHDAHAHPQEVMVSETRRQRHQEEGTAGEERDEGGCEMTWMEGGQRKGWVMRCQGWKNDGERGHLLQNGERKDVLRRDTVTTGDASYPSAPLRPSPLRPV